MLDVRIETDLRLIHRIANSDGVREFIRPDGAPTDWSSLSDLTPSESRAIVLSNGHDAIGAFDQTAPGVYQSHTMFAASCRGRRAIDTGRAMVAWMFDHGADIVWGATPRTNRKACWFNRQLGAVETPTSDSEDAVFEIRCSEWRR